MFVIHISSRFKRSFKKIPAYIKDDFAKKVDILASDPFDLKLRTHKLKGNLREYYAFCLDTGFRVIFDFQPGKVILLVNIGSHDDYTKWSKH